MKKKISYHLGTLSSLEQGLIKVHGVFQSKQIDYALSI